VSSHVNAVAEAEKGAQDARQAADAAERQFSEKTVCSPTVLRTVAKTEVASPELGRAMPDLLQQFIN